MLRSCEVCTEKTTLHRSGITCCNGCITFVRRRQLHSRTAIECRSENHCNSNIIRKCPKCRLEKFEESVRNSGEMVQIEKEMKRLSSERATMFQTMHVSRGLELSNEEMISSNISSHFVAGRSTSQKEWVMINMYTSIDYLKKLSVFGQLSNTDQYLFLQHNHSKFSLFTLAFFCWKNHYGKLQYPGNHDFFSNGILNEQRISPNFLQQIRTSFYTKIGELNMSDLEFVVLSNYVACSAEIEELSWAGKIRIKGHQDSSMELIKYQCTRVHANQKRAMERYCSLLSIGPALHQIETDIENVLLLRDMYKSFK